MQDTITITIGKDEAIIVCDLLSTFRDQSEPPIRDAGERAALWSLEAILEKNLGEPFLPEYRRLLVEAKRRLVAQYGLSTQFQDDTRGC